MWRSTFFFRFLFTSLQIWSLNHKILHIYRAFVSAYSSYVSVNHEVFHLFIKLSKGWSLARALTLAVSPRILSFSPCSGSLWSCPKAGQAFSREGDFDPGLQDKRADAHWRFPILKGVVFQRNVRLSTRVTCCVCQSKWHSPERKMRTTIAGLALCSSTRNIRLDMPMMQATFTAGLKQISRRIL